MKTTPIAIELKEFLERSSLKAADLARESGVSNAVISHVVTGNHKDMLSRQADALREAMRRLSASAEPTDAQS